MNSKKRSELWQALESKAHETWKAHRVEVDRTKNALDSLEGNIEQLEGLKFQYQKQIANSLEQSMEQFKFVRLREFVTTLDATIEQATSQLEELSMRLMEAQRESALLLSEEKKFGLLKERHERKVAHLADKSEQKRLDEISGKKGRVPIGQHSS